MFENDRIHVCVSVFRDTGETLGSLYAREAIETTSVEEAHRYADRVKAWLEEMPHSDYDPALFPTKRTPTQEDLLRIIDGLYRPEQLFLPTQQNGRG